MRIVRDFICLMALLMACSHISRAQTATYKCTYNHGLETEFIGTTTLKTKIVAKKEFNNLKYTFVLSNTNNFSELDDYVVIENDRGHKITYPLSCK